ncbi:hypothetical protein [Asticcacaulis sp. 201]|uniref:hypothetical protein n=1 Tax=Asticcacaulis sp. 201 TaxID=3028787 RepID=UPI002916138E|nr:hypothetical protein [Asticcacaulis sp. 201]MDV6333068.1 hypothetical protein [Asticcacaulis sp. 201]
MAKRVVFACIFTLALAGTALAQQQNPIEGSSSADDGNSTSVNASISADSSLISILNSNTSVNSAIAANITSKASVSAAQASADAAARSAEVAKIGIVSGSSISSNEISATSISDGADASLLIADQMVEAATVAAIDIAKKANEGGQGPILVVADPSELDQSESLYFSQQVKSIEDFVAISNTIQTAALTAELKLPPPPKGALGSARNLTFGTVGAAVDNTAKLLSYFNASYGFGTISSVDPASAELPRYLAQALKSVNPDASLPISQKIYFPSAIIPTDLDLIASDLRTLQSDYASMSAASASYKDKSATLKKLNTPAALMVAVQYDAADAAASKAMTTYDALLTWLTTKDDAKVPNIVKVIKGKKVAATAGADGMVLSVSAHGVAANYTKKDIWSVFGGPPLWVKGGVIVSYQLVVLSTGEVVASGGGRQASQYKKILSIH